MRDGNKRGEIKNSGCFSGFFFLFFHHSRWKFFDEKDLKTATRRFNRASSAKTPLFREKKRQMMMAKYVAFSLLFLYETTYIPKKKKKTIISSIRPHHRYINRSIER